VVSFRQIESVLESNKLETPLTKGYGGFDMSVDAGPQKSAAVSLPSSHPDIECMDPALELWVDVENIPVIVRLRGTLDGQTGTNVRGVVEELLQEGYSSIAMELDELKLPSAAGFSALVAIQELVTRAGGTLHWSSWSPDTDLGLG
jgi:anti-anti-sigma factor